MNVLVLDGNENQAVAATRSLGRAGHHVSVGAPTAWSKAGWSRYAKAVVRYPTPQEDAGAFVRRIAAVVSAMPGTLVLPMTERSTLPLSEQREQIFAAGGRLILPPHPTVLRAFDKHAMTALAQQLGVAVPVTRLLATADDPASVTHSLAYPLVLKGKSSEEVTAQGGVRATGAPVYVQRPDELDSAVRTLRTRCTEILVQEFVPGTGGGYFALLRDGELRAEFAHRRIRDVRPTGSGSALRVSVTPDPRVRDAALAILGALRWHGIAMVEFRIRPDGTPVFLELNARFWNSLALAVHAGVDFPVMLVRMAEQGDVPPLDSYREGVRCRWLLGDVRHLIEVWRGRPAGYPGPFPAKLHTLAHFLRPVPGTYHDNFEWSDPLPEAGDWLDFLVRRLPDRRRGRG